VIFSNQSHQKFTPPGTRSFVWQGETSDVFIEGSFAMAGIFRGFLLAGTLKIWMVYFMENPMKIWMRTGGTPSRKLPLPSKLLMDVHPLTKCIAIDP